jgi:hypothetical protein
MGEPSRTPGARELADDCVQRYQPEAVPPEIQHNLEQLADFFLFSPPLRAIFRDRLVDWSRFNGVPNSGHVAVADFLACGAATAAITTNFDMLVEEASKQLGDRAFQATVETDEAHRHSDHRPLLKIHGCMGRNRDQILWSRNQIEGMHPDPPLAARITAWRTWMAANLQGRDLVIVGFWTDWAYLNSVLEGVLDGTNPALIYLVNPGPAEELEQKAPGLWSISHRNGVFFRHVQQTGTEFLRNLRNSFNRKFFEHTLHRSISAFKAITGSTVDPAVDVLPAAANSEDLYDLRRDICGVPAGHVVRELKPKPHMEVIGATHLRLQARGAILSGARYRISDGTTVRVVNGAGRVMSMVRAEFTKRQPQTIGKEIVICDAQEDGNAPANIMRESTAATVVRTGTTAEWMTLQAATTRGLL